MMFAFKSKLSILTIVLSCVFLVSPAQATSKTGLVSNLQSAVGYGGMIHQFKNYVLRQEAERVGKVTAKIASARGVLDEYEAIANAAEKAAIADIRGVLANYEAKMEDMIILAVEGKTPEEIDASVKVSDGPALSGIKVLQAQAAVEGGADAKEAALSDIQSAMGYGGVIHQFKNYVLRKDDGRVAKIKAKSAAVSAAIAAYRAAGVSASEEAALKGIEETLAAYSAGVDKAKSLAASGSSSQEIDRAVKVSDDIALAAIKTLAGS